MHTSPKTPIRKRKAITSDEDEFKHSADVVFTPKRTKLSPPSSLLYSLPNSHIFSPNRQNQSSNLRTSQLNFTKRLNSLSKEELIDVISELVHKLDQDEQKQVLTDIWGTLEPSITPQKISKWLETELSQKIAYWNLELSKVQSRSAEGHARAMDDATRAISNDLYNIQATTTTYANHFARSKSSLESMTFLSSVLSLLLSVPAAMDVFKRNMLVGLYDCFTKCVTLFWEERRSGKIAGFGVGREFDRMLQEAIRLSGEVPMPQYVDLKEAWDRLASEVGF